MAVVVALLASCSGQTPSPTVVTVSRAIEQTTTSTVSTSSTLSCGLKPLSALPEEVSDVTTLLVDLDDGEMAVTTYLIDGAEWRLRFEFLAVPTPEGVDVPVEGAEAFMPVRPVGHTDIDGDGDGEVFVTVNSGAYTDLVGLWTVGDCAVDRVMLAGSPAVFPLGGSASSVTGYRCDSGYLEIVEANSVDGEVFSGEVLVYALDGSSLTEVDRRPMEGGLADVAAVASSGC